MSNLPQIKVEDRAKRPANSVKVLGMITRLAGALNTSMSGGRGHGKAWSERLERVLRCRCQIASNSSSQSARGRHPYWSGPGRQCPKARDHLSIVTAFGQSFRATAGGGRPMPGTQKTNGSSRLRRWLLAENRNGISVVLGRPL